MSRFRRIVHSVASGYFVLVAASFYALATLPLALHYLSRESLAVERLGLWTLMASISGYLSQIDMGMSGSLARLLIDHKDDRTSGNYGSLIKTGWLVLLVQGTMILAVGFVFAPLLASLLEIQVELRPEFISLMRWMTTSLALSFYTKIFSYLLQAHQRMDLINYSQIINLVTGFALIWLFFSAGYGVMGLAWSTLITALLGNLILAICCWKMHLFPSKEGWGRASWIQFKEIFAFGKDIFLVSLGNQLIMASQPLIITRQLGIATATLWYAGTRIFNLIGQAIWKISDVSMPAFAEMMVRGETILLRERYKAVVILTASFSAFCAVAFALCNSLFVNVWTSFSKKAALIWPSYDDLLLGLWMISLAVLHCHNTFVIYTKKIGFMRYVYFFEGAVFVLISFFASRAGGLPAIIVTSIVCSLTFSGAYGIWRVSHFLEIPIRNVAFTWMTPMVNVLLMFGLVGILTWLVSAPIRENVLKLLLRLFVCVFFGLPILLRYGLPTQIQKELVQRAPRFFNPILKLVFAAIP